MKKLIIISQWLLMPAILLIMVFILLSLNAEGNTIHISNWGKNFTYIAGSLTIFKLCIDLSSNSLLLNKWEDLENVDKWKSGFNDAVRKYHDEAEKFKEALWKLNIKEK